MYVLFMYYCINDEINERKCLRKSIINPTIYKYIIV